MASLERTDVERSLKTKGFRQSERDHHWFDLYQNGRRTGIYTKTSNSHKTIDKSNVGKMARQVKLSHSQFVDFVECRLSEQAYVRILVEKGELTADGD